MQRIITYAQLRNFAYVNDRIVRQPFRKVCLGHARGLTEEMQQRCLKAM